MFTIFIYMLAIASKNYAVLLNSSRGFCNYRHMANVYVFHEVLKQNGFSDEQVIIVSYENQIEDVRNADKRFVYLDEDWRIPYSRFCPTESALDIFLNTIEGNHPKLKDMNESSNILMYLCGHGNESFLKFGSMHFMTKDDLMSRVLRLSSRVNKLLLILDTCQAEALVELHRVPKNVFVLATSERGESSISSFSSSLIRTHTVDNFPHFFLRKTEEDFDKRTKLTDLFSSLNLEALHSKLIFTTGNDFTFDDFFVQNDVDEVLPFRLGQPATSHYL